MKYQDLPSSKNIIDKRAYTQGSSGPGGGREYNDLRYIDEIEGTTPRYTVQKTGVYHGNSPKDAVKKTFRSDEKD